jgi:hypothetical protein
MMIPLVSLVSHRGSDLESIANLAYEVQWDMPHELAGHHSKGICRRMARQARERRQLIACMTRQDKLLSAYQRTASHSQVTSHIDAIMCLGDPPPGAPMIVSGHPSPSEDRRACRGFPRSFVTDAAG